MPLFNVANDEATVQVTSIDKAEEHMLDLGGGISLWYRTWGNQSTGIPVLFVHGGPGNSVDDYQNINAQFFEPDRFFVVEVDQRGTGRSQPSVRDSFLNMSKYVNISIEQMSADFEVVRETLHIRKWLVFGGSWGSTLSLDYGLRYPERCLGLIVRGIFLNTKKEFDTIYARNSFLNNQRRLNEFDIFFELAAKEARESGEAELNPNDSERFLRLYERMIMRGDRDAIWRFYVFENNLIEEDPTKLLDPYNIVEEEYPVAQSVAFFETRLFVHGTFEEPVNLLERVHALKTGVAGHAVHTWICQGTGDEVCPEIFAHELDDALEGAGVPHTAHFVKAGHAAKSNGMTVCLKKCVDDFYSRHTSYLEVEDERPKPIRVSVTA